MSSSITVLVVCACIISVAIGDSGGEWNYNRDDAVHGPSAWGEEFHECSGSSNSPINLKTEDASKKPLESWSLTGWDQPTMWTVKDKNYSLQYDLETANSIKTSGGDLGTYLVEQFHVHWGSSNDVGSEHTLEGKEFPMEIHFVHKRNDFDTATDAVVSGQDDAVAVLGFFFTIQAEDNAQLTKMVDGFVQARASVDAHENNFELNALSDFAGTAMEGNFYRYYGGLTTPGCNQVVKWTVFETPIGISAAQMATIRNGTANSYGTEYYRPVVPLGERPLTLYDAVCADATCAAPRMLASVSLLTLFSFFCKYL